MALDLANRFAIQELLHRYCHIADYDAPEAMREVFTADAVFEVPTMNIRFEGIDNIIAFFRHSRAGFGGARHIISNVVIEGDGSAAASTAYLQVVNVDGDPKSIVSFGRYTDRLQHTPQGWRFTHRLVLIG